MYQVTYHGVHEWSKSIFEKLGWMVLAQAHKHESKIAEYKAGIEHLIDALEHLEKETQDTDRKRDLSVLKSNAVALQKHVIRAFSSAGGKSIRKS